MVEYGGKKLCENCFEEITSQPCPHCGFTPAVLTADPTILPPGSILLGKYIVGRTIGKGGFGITYLAYDTSCGKKVAIKEFYPYGLALRTGGNPTVSVSNEENATVFKTGAERFYEEAKLVSRFNGNPNIVAVNEFFYENDTVYFAMEYLSGRTLKSYVQNNGTLNAGQALFIARNVATALMAAHSATVLHRDISPDNIMLCDNGNVKLIDFGAARQVVFEQSQTFSVILKPGFAPLEQYRKKGKQGPWTDIYSLGATLFFALTGEIPDDPMSRQEEDESFGENKYGINDELWEIIVKATKLNIPDRYQDVFMLLKDLNQVSFPPEPLIVPQAQPAAPTENFRTAKPFGAATAMQSTQPITQPVLQPTQSAVQPVQGAVQPAQGAVQPAQPAQAESGESFFTKHRKGVIAGACSAAGVAVAAVIITLAITAASSKPDNGSLTSPDYLPNTTSSAAEATGNVADTPTSPTEPDATEPEEITTPAPADTTPEPQESTPAPEVTTPKPEVTTTTKATTTTKKPAVTTTTKATTTTKKPAVTTTTKATTTTKKPAVTTTTKATTTTKKPAVTTTTKATTTTKKPAVTTTTKATTTTKKPAVTTTTKATTTTKKPAATEPEELKEVKIGAHTYSVDLTHLDLSNKGLRDSDVKNLKYMTKLDTLILTGNKLTDISFVKTMPNLWTLHIEDNNISDLSPLKGLSKLKFLIASDNPVSSVSALKGMKSLLHIDLNNSKVTDLSPLADCTGIYRLEFKGCNISDISALKNMSNLSWVQLSKCNIRDLSPLAGKKYLNCLFLLLNPINDISPLKDCTNLEYINLSSTYISEPSALRGCTKIKMLNLSNNPVSGDSIEFFEGVTINDKLLLNGNGLTKEQIDRLKKLIKGSPEIEY